MFSVRMIPHPGKSSRLVSERFSLSTASLVSYLQRRTMLLSDGLLIKSFEARVPY